MSHHPVQQGQKLCKARRDLRNAGELTGCDLPTMQRFVVGFAALLFLPIPSPPTIKATAVAWISQQSSRSIRP